MEKDNVVFPQNLYYIPISGQKQNKGYYFCIPDKISNQLRQTSRGFQPRELHTYAESESEENRRIEIKNTSSFHLPSGLHFIMSRDSRHLKSSLPQFSVKWLSLMLAWARPGQTWPDLGITGNIKNQFYEAMRLNVFLYILTGCFLAGNISFNFLKRILKCK